MSAIASNNGDYSIQEIHKWLDDIPLSRPIKNMARDFSDGVLMAELLKRYFPKFVHLYNYSAVNSAAKKLDNWHTLNRKVLSKIHFKISKENIEKLAHSRPGTIEDVLIELRSKILEDHNSRQDALLNAYKNGMGDINTTESNPGITLNETVPLKLFVKLKEELEEKTDAINILLKKVEHLENMLQNKNHQIRELMTTKRSIKSFR